MTRGADEYIAQIDEILNRYGSIIETCMPVFRQQAYETSLNPRVQYGDAARWLRAKGYPKDK